MYDPDPWRLFADGRTQECGDGIRLAAATGDQTGEREKRLLTSLQSGVDDGFISWFYLVVLSRGGVSGGYR